VKEICLALVAGLALSGCSLLSAGSDLAQSRPAHDGWIVDVSVEPTDLGPLAVSVGPVRDGPESESRAWIQHDLVVTNTGTGPVTFADSRTGARLGRHGSIFVADQGCGYGGYGRRIELACALYLDIPTVKPDRALVRTVTLWKELRGMHPLEAGTYVFRKELSFRIGRTPPGRDAGRKPEIRIVYHVAPA
jgi:hypothetical protein